MDGEERKRGKKESEESEEEGRKGDEISLVNENKAESLFDLVLPPSQT